MISKIYNQIICPGTLGHKAREKAHLGRYNLIILVVIIIGLSAIPVCRDLWRLWHSGTNFQGLMLVPIACGILFYNTRKDFTSCTPNPTKKILYALPVTLSFMLIASYYRSPRIAGVLLVISLWLASVSIFGLSSFKLFIGPFLFLMLMVPLPLFVIDSITVNLQRLLSLMAEIIFLCCSDSFEGRCEFIFFFAEIDRPPIITPECSGIRSLQGFIIIISYFWIYDRHSIVTAVILMSCGVALAISLNLLRILITIWISLSGYEEYSAGTWHGFLGIAVFTLGFLILRKLSCCLGYVDHKNHRENKV